MNAKKKLGSYWIRSNDAHRRVGSASRGVGSKRTGKLINNRSAAVRNERKQGYSRKGLYLDII